MSATNVTDWKQVARDHIFDLIAAGSCFSSGEVAKHLRENHTELRFSVRALGEYVRDLWYTGQMPSTDDGYGNQWPMNQVPRITTGISRTPPGMQVFVYGCDTQECLQHPFEVDIPSFGQPTPSPVANPPIQPGVSIQGSAVIGSLVAKVHTDGRLCIPRAAFESYVHATGKPMQGGQAVYVTVNSEEVLTVSLEDKPGASTYDLSRTRGRVLIAHPRFTPGDRYEIQVDEDALSVDLVEGKI